MPALPGVCPSGQRERAVNPSAQPTEVRILPPPLTSQTTNPDGSHVGVSRFGSAHDGSNLLGPSIREDAHSRT